MAFITNVPSWGPIPEAPLVDLLYATRELEWARIQPGITGLGRIARWQSSHGLQPYSCTFSPCGNDSLTDKEVRNCLWKVNKEECIINLRNFYNHNIAPYNNPAGSNPIDAVALAANYWATETLRHIGQSLAPMLWQLDATQPALPGCENIPLGGTVCDGWLRQLITGGAVRIHSGTVPPAVTPWTAGNIIGEIQKVYNAIPTVMKAQPGMLNDLAIFMPWTAEAIVRNAYTAAAPVFLQGEFTQNVQGLEPVALDGERQFLFQNVPIVFTHGLPDFHMVATNRENLIVLVDQVSDLEQPLQLLDMRPQGDDVYRLKGTFYLGAAVAQEEYAVVYTPNP